MFMQSYVPDVGSRFAEIDEIKRVSSKVYGRDAVLAAAGVPVYSNGTESYVVNSDCHTAVYGSTSSMKTRRVIMPTVATLIKAGESIVCHDPKAEIIKRFSGLLEQRGYKVIILNYRDPLTGSRWNPLTTAYRLAKSGKRDKAIEMLRDIAMCVYSSLMSKTDDVFWANAALDYWVGLALLLLEEVDEEAFTFENIRIAHVEGNKSFECSTHLKEYLKNITSNNEIAANLNGTVNAPTETRGGVYAVYSQPMSLYSANNLCDMMCRSDYELSTIGKEKTAVFLITPDEKSTYYPLISTHIKLCYSVLIDTAESEECDGSLPVRVNFVIDEFANLPPIPDMSNMISAARSRNIRFVLVVQNLGQLYRSYSAETAETIISNCDVWHILRSNDYRLHELMQKMCGNHVSEYTHTIKPLIDTTTIQRLSKERGEVIIKIIGQHPFITELPDISCYDFDIPVGKDIVFKKRKPVQRKLFDFDKVSGKKRNSKSKTTMDKLDNLAMKDLFSPEKTPKINRNVKKSILGILDGDSADSYNTDELIKMIDDEIERIDRQVQAEIAGSSGMTQTIFPQDKHRQQCKNSIEK